MEPIVIAVVIGVVVYFGIVAMIPKHILADTTQYTRSMIQQLERESMTASSEESASIFREQMQRSNALTRVFYTMPGARMAYPKLLKAGLTNNIEQFFFLCLVTLILLVFALKSFGAAGIALAIALTYLVAYMVIKHRVGKRNEVFLNLFPDALDMIVRSVRSGYPLNAAVRMVADNMQAPVSTEFKQVADEIAYGSTLIDALRRLATRIDEPDIRFFVLMVSVQQEVGGNLSEVLSNLSSIIRKRKQLRMKIKAMTSEGRATAIVLGSLPIVVAGLIHWVAPDHLEPLFTTHTGNMILFGSIGILLAGFVIIRQMVNMEI